MLWLSVVVLSPFIAVIIYQGIEPNAFILTQLYDIQAYSYFPLLVMSLGELSYLYILIAVGLLVYYITDYFFSEKDDVRDEIAFLLVFVLVALRFTPLLNIGELFWIDIDQLNDFYAILV
ncbi:MAG: hypothetical protein U5J63_00730 [Fodinibius sp.]|nr:hypothetical protein [Fodinibius sp.]